MTSSQPRLSGSRPSPMVRGEHIFLRPAERSDIPLFVAWLNDHETSRSLTLRAPLSVPYRGGRYRDADRMSLLRGEWEATSRPKRWERDAS